ADRSVPVRQRAPLSVIPNVTEDNVNIMLFQERSDEALAVDLPIDAHVAMTYDGTLPAGAIVPAGTRVNVYFLHFDPVGGALTNKIATLTFPEEIIGLILKRDTLFATDPLVGLTSTVA